MGLKYPTRRMLGPQHVSHRRSPFLSGSGGLERGLPESLPSQRHGPRGVSPLAARFRGLRPWLTFRPVKWGASVWVFLCFDLIIYVCFLALCAVLFLSWGLPLKSATNIDNRVRVWLLSHGLATQGKARKNTHTHIHTQTHQINPRQLHVDDGVPRPPVSPFGGPDRCTQTLDVAMCRTWGPRLARYKRKPALKRLLGGFGFLYVTSFPLGSEGIV